MTQVEVLERPALAPPAPQQGWMPALTNRQALLLLAQPSGPWISWSPMPSEWSWLRSSWLVVQEERAQVWLQRAVQTYSNPAHTYLYVQALVLQGRFEALHLGAESRAVATPVPGLFLSEVCCGLQISQEVDYGTCLANSGLG